MTQLTDIVLAGDGYMIAPGTYRRMSDGVSGFSPVLAGSIFRRT